MPTDQPKDLDLTALLRVLRRAALPLLATALLLAGLTYLLSGSRPAVYEATASLAALPTGSGNSVIVQTLVTAPPLPPAVVERALRSPAVWGQALRDLRERTPPSAARSELFAALRAEAATGEGRYVRLTPEVNQEFVGVYEIAVRAPTPALAQAGANAFAGALLEWDRERALGSVVRARQNLVTERDDLTARLSQAASALDERTLERLRADVVQRLQQVEVLEQTVSGTLSALAEAVPPQNPVAPRPLRDALLVFGATLVFGMLLLSLLDSLRPRVRGPEDLRALGLPVLGTLPPFAARRGRSGGLGWARQGAFREQIEFVRVGLLSGLGAGAQQSALVVSSAGVADGKSTVTAALALSLAEYGLRVLVVDADVFRRTQESYWLSAEAPLAAQERSGSYRFWPEVAPGIGLLSSRASTLDPADFDREIHRLLPSYDLALVDTPPALKIADTLALARRLDGLILVTDAAAPRAPLERLVEDAGRLGVPLLGFVLNRFRDAVTGSDYAYAAPGRAPAEVTR